MVNFGTFNRVLKNIQQIYQNSIYVPFKYICSKYKFQNKNT